MKKKETKAQLLLISVGLFLVLATYFYYPTIQQQKNSSQQIKDRTLQVDRDSDQSSNNEDSDQSSNNEDSNQSSNNENIDQNSSFKNVEYKGLYDFDKTFIVKSEDAFILNDDPDIIYMNKMFVTLYLSDNRIVNIKSDKGKYNKVTYDIFFEKNVIATDESTKIFSENLDLLATANTVEIYNNVRLDDAAGLVTADKINYDFETKLFKVSMYDDKSVNMKVIR
jgi:hypothetical protein